jgi:hypothetical protein
MQQIKPREPGADDHDIDTRVLIRDRLRLCSGHAFTPVVFALLVTGSISRITRKRKQEIGRRCRGILPGGMPLVRLASPFPIR